jgi:acetyl-CoA decarbonylase/synthase complex subunit gamma
MALTGLDIYKQLPKKNCGECGPPTCLAFAMQLAAGKASLDACPYVTEEARENLSSAAAPPIKTVVMGTGETALKMGDETVIYRHDKTFVSPTGIFIRVTDTMAPEDLEAKIKKVTALVFDRVGQTFRVDGVAVMAKSGDAEAFKATLKAARDKTQWNLIVDVRPFAGNQALMEEIVGLVAERKPLLYAATVDNFEAVTEVAKKYGCPLAVLGSGLDDVANLSAKVAALDYKELVLDPGERELSLALAALTQIRRLSVKKKFRPFGYPTIAFTKAQETDLQVVEASMYVAKFASIVVMDACELHELLPLITWRLNVYTDPQKPIQVEAKVWTVGNVTPESPVYVTTNFSLSYFAVEGEVDASKVPGYILAVDTDGTSVLTAWAAGKFSGESIAEAIKASGLEEMVNHREVVIPGHVAVLSGKLQELSGWKVLVGPREASGIPAWVRSRKQ